MNYLERANEIQRELKELEHFLFTATRYDKKETATLSVKIFLKKKVDIKYSLFGSRFFGFGKHLQEIQIPNQLRNDIINITENRMNALKKEEKDVLLSGIIQELKTQE